MNDRLPSPPVAMSELRGLLHAVNDELSVAILGLDLLLEDAELEPEVRQGIVESLDACRQAAARQREAWAVLDRCATER